MLNLSESSVGPTRLIPLSYSHPPSAAIPVSEVQKLPGQVVANMCKHTVVWKSYLETPVVQHTTLFYLELEQAVMAQKYAKLFVRSFFMVS